MVNFVWRHLYGFSSNSVKTKCTVANRFERNFFCVDVVAFPIFSQSYQEKHNNIGWMPEQYYDSYSHTYKSNELHSYARTAIHTGFEWDEHTSTTAYTVQWTTFTYTNTQKETQTPEWTTFSNAWIALPGTNTLELPHYCIKVENEYYRRWKFQLVDWTKMNNNLLQTKCSGSVATNIIEIEN